MRGKKKVKRIKSKKAQVPAQMFTYILTLIIIGLMLYFGVSWIGNLMGTSERISTTQLKVSLEDAFEEMKGNYGSMHRYDFQVPGDIAEVCFLNRSQSEQATHTIELPDVFCDKNPHMCQVWLDPNQNIAFEPELGMPIEVKDVVIDEEEGDVDCDGKCLCKDIIQGGFSVRLVGRGDAVEVKRMPELGG